MHYLVMVIGEDVDAQLEPYAEDLEVEEYLVGELDETDKERMLEFYKSRGEEYESFDECYKEKGDDWDGGRCRKDEDGIWREYSAYNTDAQWDWWQVGGRWAGRIIVKEGVEYEKPGFSWGWSEEEKKVALAERRTDSALLKDIENRECLTAYAILKEGEWYDNGYDDLSEELIADILKGVGEDERITFVDCHM